MPEMERRSAPWYLDKWPRVARQKLASFTMSCAARTTMTLSPSLAIRATAHPSASSSSRSAVVNHPRASRSVSVRARRPSFVEVSSTSFDRCDTSLRCSLSADCLCTVSPRATRVRGRDPQLAVDPRRECYRCNLTLACTPTLVALCGSSSHGYKRSARVVPIQGRDDVDVSARRRIARPASHVFRFRKS